MEKQPKFRRRSEARPDEILDAALELFLAKGFAQTKVEDVAQKANVSKGTVYLYFSSKEALLEGLVRRAVAPLATHAAAELAAGTDHPRETLTRVMRGLAAAVGDKKTLAVPVLVVREAPNVPSIAKIYREEVLSHVVPALSGLIERARAGRIIRDVDPDLTVRTIIGPIVVHVLMAQVFEIRPEGGLQLEKLIDNHLKIIFEGLTPERPAP